MLRLRSIARLLSGLRTDGGNVAILFAVLLPVVVGGAGLGVETTFWRYKQLQIQTAADAAAFAGALEKRAGSNATLIEGAATTAATQNGFDTVNGDLDI